MSTWSVFLVAYNYQLVYRPGKDLSNADSLSHCPLPLAVEDPAQAPVSFVLLIDELPALVTAADVAKYSTTLIQVLDLVHRGWPQGLLPGEFRPYVTRQHKLSSSHGCLLRGSRVVIPPKLRGPILKCLHEGHPGIAKMKILGYSYMWCPKLDQAMGGRMPELSEA